MSLIKQEALACNHLIMFSSPKCDYHIHIIIYREYRYYQVTFFFSGHYECFILAQLPGGRFVVKHSVQYIFLNGECYPWQPSNYFPKIPRPSTYILIYYENGDYSSHSYQFCKWPLPIWDRIANQSRGLMGKCDLSFPFIYLVCRSYLITLTYR